MTAATVLLDLLSCCAAGTELFGNEPQSDFCDSCSFFVLFSRKGSCCVFILLARTGSSWGDTGKVGRVPLKELNLFSRILKVSVVENKTLEFKESASHITAGFQQKLVISLPN